MTCRRAMNRMLPNLDPDVDDADADGLYLYWYYLDRTICVCIVAGSFRLIAKTARRDPFYFTYRFRGFCVM